MVFPQWVRLCILLVSWAGSVHPAFGLQPENQCQAVWKDQWLFLGARTVARGTASTHLLAEVDVGGG